MPRKPAKPAQTPLRGKRIVLRPPRAADFSEYARLIKTSAKTYRGLLPPFKGKKQFDDYLDNCHREDFFGFLICRREDGTIVGNINLFNIVHRSVRSAITGYFVGAPFARRGYATEALQLLLRFAFRKLRLHRIEASIQPHNRPSLALVKRAGFVLEGYSPRLVKIGGQWRDHQRWAILSEDWQPRRAMARLADGSPKKSVDVPAPSSSHPRWLQWSTRLQAIAQNGLTYGRDRFDLERYSAVRELAAEMLATGAGEDITVVRELISRDSGYATPKVDVRGVVFREGKLLLVRETSDGAWALPGGWADVGESPAENVVREIREEAGFETRAEKILAVFDRAKHPHAPPLPFHVYKIFILCKLVSGTATPSHETDAVKFFGEDELPTPSLTRVTAGQLRRLFEHHRHPELPTDFDV